MREPVKFDAGKVDWSILPISAIESIIECLKFGENKYARGNYAIGTGLSYTRVTNSLLRHIFAFMRGEDRDPETGLSHMAHAGCCVLFLLHYINNDYTKNDDRKSMVMQEVDNHPSYNSQFYEIDARYDINKLPELVTLSPINYEGAAIAWAQNAMRQKPIQVNTQLSD